MANDDLLSRVQLRAVALLEASTYFTPVSGVRIPIVSEVRDDIVQAIKHRQPAGMICIVALEEMPNADKGGGCLRVEEGRILVRVREVISTNRGSSGTGENALRVAQAVVPVLHLQKCAMTSDVSPTSMGGIFTFLNIEPALADPVPGGPVDGVLAYHVRFRFAGTITPFTRRGSAAVAGSP